MNVSKVFVYFNLHKKVWSVKCLKTGRVIAHSNTVLLRDCEYRVSKRGRERVLSERVKNVHAGVVGTLVALDARPDMFYFDNSQIVTYNPYKYETFVTKTGEYPVYHSNTAYMLAQNGTVAVHADPIYKVSTE